MKTIITIDGHDYLLSKTSDAATLVRVLTTAIKLDWDYPATTAAGHVTHWIMGEPCSIEVKQVFESRIKLKQKETGRNAQFHEIVVESGKRPLMLPAPTHE